MNLKKLTDRELKYYDRKYTALYSAFFREAEETWVTIKKLTIEQDRRKNNAVARNRR
jgi:hypothetical protein